MKIWLHFSVTHQMLVYKCLCRFSVLSSSPLLSLKGCTGDEMFHFSTYEMVSLSGPLLAVSVPGKFKVVRKEVITEQIHVCVVPRAGCISVDQHPTWLCDTGC